MPDGKSASGPAAASGASKSVGGEKVVKVAGAGTVVLPSRKSLVAKSERRLTDAGEEKDELKRAARVVPWPKRGGALKFRTSFTNTVLDVCLAKGWERTQASRLGTEPSPFRLFGK